VSRPPTKGAQIRVCHVIHSLRPGGAEDLLVELGREAGEHGIEMTVIALITPEDSAIPEELRAAGVRVEFLGLSSRWDPRGFPRGERAIRAAAPDIIHTHLKHADLVGAFASRRLGIPMVSTLHIVDSASSLVRRAKRWLGSVARRHVADLTIAVSDAQRDWYVREFGADPARVVTLHNGVRDHPPVDAPTRAACRDALGVPSDHLLALMLALMRPGKGHIELLAAARAIGSHAGVTFVLAGDGVLRSTFEAEAEAASPTSAPVVFAGYRRDVAQLLASSDIVIHPSLADALPTALIHALAAGRSIIASRVGGIPEIVPADAGLLVEPGDVAGLVNAIETLAADPARRSAFGAGGRRRYEEEFEISLWINRLRAHYERVLTSPRSASRARRSDDR
jgi:glycosyltransferase involved in cell wall biosynthesis